MEDLHQRPMLPPGQEFPRLEAPCSETDHMAVTGKTNPDVASSSLVQPRRRSFFAWAISPLPETDPSPLSPENVLLVFFAAGLLGTLAETLYCLLCEGRFAWRAGLMFVPVNPVYCMGGMCLYLLLRKFRRKQKMLIFLSCYVLGTATEYIFSLLQEAVLGSVSWDYSGMLFNLNGRVCLIYSLSWGGLGLFWVLFLNPLLEKLLAGIPRLHKKQAVWILGTTVLCGMVFSGLAILSWRARTLGLPTPPYALFFNRFCPDDMMTWFYYNLTFAP